MCVAQENADTAITRSPANREGHGLIAKGTVVHISSKNCSTIIRYIDPETKDTTEYIPLGEAFKPYDKPGTLITFNYRKSLIREPMGCTGMPVIVSNVKVVSNGKHHKKTRAKTTAAQ